MRTEQQIRIQGFSYQNVERAFIWDNIGRDLMREIVEADPKYKTLLDRHIISALQGFASYPSMFYQNACYYIQNGLAEQKDLVNYVNQLYMLYRDQAEREYNSRQVVNFTDNTGIVREQWII